MLRQGFAALAAALVVAPSALAANHPVSVSGFSFSPSSVNATTGDTVTVGYSGGGVQHNVRWADRAQAEMAPTTASWSTQRTMDQAGSFVLFCEVHGSAASGMRATVNVTAPAGTEYVYTGVNGGTWETGTNWTPTGIPGPGDTATIGGGKTVFMNGDHTVARLDMSADAGRAGTGVLTITGGGTWTSARTTGAKTILAATAELTWNGGFLFEGELENLGQLTIGDVLFGNASPGADVAVLDNQGTTIVTGDLTDVSQGGAVLQNPGSLSGHGGIGPPVSNSGTFSAQGGVLELKNGSITPNAGDYAAAAGATLRFNGSTAAESGARVTGLGTLDVQGILDLPKAADDVTIAHVVVGGVFSVGGGTAGTLDLDGDAHIVAHDTLVATGGTNAWTTAYFAGPGTVRAEGTTTLESVQLTGSTTLDMRGPTTIGAIEFGDGEPGADGEPKLVLGGATTLAPAASFTDLTGGGAPKVTVAGGGTLTLGTRQITLPAAFASSGTLAVTLAGANEFGRLTAGGPVTLGGALAVSGAFKPADALRVLVTSAEPSGSFASVTAGYEAPKDATGVLVKAKAEPAATATPAPTAEPSAAPTPAPTPAPVTLTPAPPFGKLVKLPACARRRSVRVTVLSPGTVRVLLGRRTLKRSSRSFSLRRLPRRAFTLKFEVTIPDGRVVSKSKRFRRC